MSKLVNERSKPKPLKSLHVDWRIYQEHVAAFFRELGLDAAIDVTVDGVRTKHDIDVLVTGTYKGIAIKWLVECKHWQEAIPKVHVLALSTIVKEVGADRAFMMSESGYQSGAKEAAYLTNVHLSSLQDLRETCGHELAMMRLKKLFDRARECYERYWKIDKYRRIDYGLRPDVGVPGYSGISVIEGSEEAIISAMIDGFPVCFNESGFKLSRPARRREVELLGLLFVQTPSDLADLIQERLTELERLLYRAE